MKKIFVFLLASFLIASCGKVENEKMITFKVCGNCDMCKNTIDSAAKSVDGVAEANWSESTGEIMVGFDSLRTDEVLIQKAIAASGYDTELEKADDKAYENLRACCQYTRKDQTL